MARAEKFQPALAEAVQDSHVSRIRSGWTQGVVVKPACYKTSAAKKILGARTAPAARFWLFGPFGEMLDPLELQLDRQAKNRRLASAQSNSAL